MNELRKHRSILIVDDDPPVANSLRRLLRRAGLDVTVAYGGKEAISQLGSISPAVIISDYRMPDISGLEVLRQARQICPNAARILISGYSEAGAFDRTAEADPSFMFFSKPWDDAALLAEVVRHTAIHNKESQNE